MLTNSGPVAKLYLSIIDDVIETMRELFMDEGLEDRVLDDLKQLWESKMMQSKAMEDFRKNNLNPSNFVLQLPVNYSQTDPELTASVVIPASQNIHRLPVKNNSEALATFSLHAGLAYPVQIPAGVTLQTASGQLYKVNVPVVVTQAPVQKPASQPPKKVTEWREAPVPQSAATQLNSIPVQEVETSVASTSVTQVSQPKADLPARQESSLPHPGGASQLQGVHSQQQEVALEEKEPSPQPEPVNLSVSASPCSQLIDFEISTEGALTQSAQLKTRDIDDILKEAIEEEREKAKRARTLASGKSDDQSEAILGLDLDYSYSELSDIVQLDGPPDNSDIKEEEGVPLEDDDFLGIINAEAIKALQEGDGSSECTSISSSSDSEGTYKIADVEEEDPLNSGDDVIEQDIPDLFDTDNVIVCQYDKIHRSKNRWKFHLKDGVMCYRGKDYVFSKAVGEAEW
ncbi:TFIIA-alpha and beta-like factor [Mastacembelus armatus]|uniref:TFIIA-alpha and beta-like factor n=1 Tax=Mastacembelus armatus TaxID=205130 RepID=UPI000E460C44|nr:TFIIA-alpha and beta-like factor [Mastacembelus armatus]